MKSFSGLDWGGVNFLHSSFHGAVFWIRVENTIGNTRMF